MVKPNEPPDAHWRDIFGMYFEKLVSNHYKAKKVYPLPGLVFLHPLDAHTGTEINATRDKIQMNSCDLAVVYLNLKIGRCLGAMVELGYLTAHHKPIILINESKEISATKFVEHNSDIVVYNLEDGAKALYNTVKDISENE
jgi:nucleoside 2-deoxyribosyltransferase